MIPSFASAAKYCWFWSILIQMKKYRILASTFVLILTAVIFAYYVKSNPEVLLKLTEINGIYIIFIAILYLGIIGTLSIVNSISVQLCGKEMNSNESFKLTATSSIANFFGPLQSGVGIRALYLKKRFNIPIKQYALVSLYYYGIYAFLSGAFLLFGSSKYRLPLLGLMLIGTSGVLYYLKYRSKKAKIKQNLSLLPIIKLFGAVLLQLTLITSIYFFELIALGKTVSLAQVISYSGAANFSLFVSITPGAIGIREAFLVFSEQLHKIDSTTVVAANILDRGIYVLFLGILFVWLASSHARISLKND